MTNKMLQFVDIGQQNPPKRDKSQRKEDFGEIYQEFIHDRAKEQSSRCSQCGVPFCQVHCPLSNNIPDWLKLTAEGRLEEAYELSQSTNNMPEVCGRICPQDRLCEGNCVIEQSGHGTVTIGSIEKYLTENRFDDNFGNWSSILHEFKHFDDYNGSKRVSEYVYELISNINKGDNTQNSIYKTNKKKPRTSELGSAGVNKNTFLSVISAGYFHSRLL